MSTIQSKPWYYFSGLMFIMRWLLLIAALLAIAATIVAIINSPLPPHLSVPTVLAILQIAPPILALTLGIVMTKNFWAKACKYIWKHIKHMLGIATPLTETPSIETQTNPESLAENPSWWQWFVAGSVFTTTLITTAALIFFSNPASGFILPAVVILITVSLTFWGWPKIKSYTNQQPISAPSSNIAERASEDTLQESSSPRSSNDISQNLASTPTPKKQSNSTSEPIIADTFTPQPGVFPPLPRENSQNEGVPSKHNNPLTSPS